MKKPYIVALFLFDKLVEVKAVWATDPDKARRECDYWWKELGVRVGASVINAYEIDLDNCSITPHGHAESTI